MCVGKRSGRINSVHGSIFLNDGSSYEWFFVFPLRKKVMSTSTPLVYRILLAFFGIAMFCWVPNLIVGEYLVWRERSIFRDL